jgi:hypothetical protein
LLPARSRCLVFALVLALADASATAADRREATRGRVEQKLDLMLLDSFYELFEAELDEMEGALPDDLKMALFLKWLDKWLDERSGEVVEKRRTKTVEDIHALTAELHRVRPRNLFYLYLLAVTERHLDRPAVAVELLKPVPEALCDVRAEIPDYDFPAPGGGQTHRGVYLYALHALHLQALQVGREDLGLGFLAQQRESWRLAFAYGKAWICEPPLQERAHVRSLVESALAGGSSDVALPEAAVSKLAREHPVWSRVLPGEFFEVFALSRLEQICFEAGEADAGSAGGLAARLTAAQHSRPGSVPVAILKASLDAGGGRRRAALEALESFWASHPSRNIPLTSLLPLAGQHASLSLREKGLLAYLRTHGFYTLLTLEALPGPASKVLTFYVSLCGLYLAGLALRRLPWCRDLDGSVHVALFARANRRRSSRLELLPADDFPRPEDGWSDRVAGEGASELAQVVAALAAADGRAREQLVGRLTSCECDLSLDESQRILREFVAQYPGSPGYWSGLLRDLSFAQFEEADRPIVELVSNAIDASRASEAASGGAAFDVLVSFVGRWRSGVEKREISRRGPNRSDDLCTVRVVDHGCGMSPRSALFDLLVPLTTSKEGVNTIGRFGVGFFSVLRYLTHPLASVCVTTSNGHHETEIVLSPPGRGSATSGPEVSLRVAPSTRGRGTCVEVRGEVDRKACEALLQRTFRFLPSPPLDLSSGVVNDLSACQRLDAGQGAEILWRHVPDSPSSLSVVVRGETVAGPFILAQPGLEVGLCLPPAAAVTLSRNLPVVDELLLSVLCRAAAAAGGLGDDSFLFLSLLAELAERLRLHHRRSQGHGALEEALCRELLALRDDRTVFLPLGPHAERIDTAALCGGYNFGGPRHCAFLHPLLFTAEGPASLEPFLVLPGRNLYAVPFHQHPEEDEEPPVTSFQICGLTFIDARYRPTTAVGRAAAALLSEPSLARAATDRGRS